MSSLRFKTRHDDHLARKIFHSLSGTIITLIFVAFLDRKQSAVAIVLGVCLTLPFDIIRLRWDALNDLAFKVFGPLMRDDEEKGVSAQFFYILGLAWAILVLPKAIAVQAILTLAWMDPMAAFFGQRFGKLNWKNFFTEKLNFQNASWITALKGKTVLGSTAGFFAALLAGIIAWMGPWASYAFEGQLIVPNFFQIVILSIVGGLTAVIAEAWPSQWDDNLSVPFWTGLIVWGVATILGVPTAF